MCIDKIEPLNAMVNKLMCEASEFQVYSAFYKVFEGDLINVRLTHNKETAEYVMSGIVYDISDAFTFISCGGLLCKMKSENVNISCGDRVFVNFNRGKRKRLNNTTRSSRAKVT